MTATFAIAPAGMRPLWLLAPMSALLLGVLAVLALAWYGSQYARFDVSPAGLRLSGDVYGRLIAAPDLRGGAARIVDLRVAAELAPRRRTFGTALPGYAAGWFRLQNGEKALLFLTDWSRAVYIPTRRGYALLMSPNEPQALLDAVRRIAPGS